VHNTAEIAGKTAVLIIKKLAGALTYPARLRRGSLTVFDQPANFAPFNRTDAHAALFLDRSTLHGLPVAAESIDCRVIGIADGDTFSCLTAHKDQVRVRLGEIDAPELKQPYGSRARQALSGLVFGKDVTLHIQDLDRYGRTVARVTVGNTDVNAEMVRTGAAWVYRDYLKDRSLLNLEAVAKEFKRGIWSLPKSEQEAPSEWRKAQRSNPVPKTVPKRPVPAATLQGGFNCSVIKSCRQMSSCAEARFQLRTCRNPRIDGDGDGIPCEAICR